MILPPGEAKLFFKLMLALQFYANQNLNVLTDISSFAEFQNALINEKYEFTKPCFKMLVCLTIL